MDDENTIELIKISAKNFHLKCLFIKININSKRIKYIHNSRLIAFACNLTIFALNCTEICEKREYPAGYFCTDLLAILIAGNLR